MLLPLVLFGCGTDCSVEAPLSYNTADNWLCYPGKEGACPSSLPIRTIQADGTTTDEERKSADAPPLACFVVYPTLDLRLGAGLHHNTESVPAAENWTRTQAALLGEVCDLYVPIYRQVLIGTYLGDTSEKKEQCFNSAYNDVLAAFNAFVEAEPNRPFVLFGHSQGGQHISRLIRERIESDAALHSRLLAAYPIGWPIATKQGSDVGGSFEITPTCSTPEQLGCVIGYRSYLQGERTPEVGGFLEAVSYTHLTLPTKA